MTLYTKMFQNPGDYGSKLGHAGFIPSAVIWAPLKGEVQGSLEVGVRQVESWYKHRDLEVQGTSTWRQKCRYNPRLRLLSRGSQVVAGFEAEFQTS